MKKILALIASVLFGTMAYADTCAVRLMPAFTAAQAVQICTSWGNGNFVLKNNTYLLARNAAGTANLNLLKADASNNTILNAPSAGLIGFAVNSVSQMNIDATTGLTLTLAGSQIIPGATSLSLRNNANTQDNFKCLDAGTCTVRAGLTVTAGDIASGTSGSTLALQEATAGAACSGSVTANATTPVVTSTTCATTASRIFLTKTSTSTVNGSCYISAISNGVSFSITCLATDTGTYNFVIFHESP